MAETKRETCRVLIFDDQENKAQMLRTELLQWGSSFLDVKVPTKQETENQLDALYERRQAVDSGASMTTIASPLDDADVLIVDFDLRDLDGHRGFATGEEIAYSARLFSSVKLVVVVNHPNFGVNNFDLTLQRDREFRADLYVGNSQVGNPGLWVAEARHQGFLPWSWIPLYEDVHTFDNCLATVRDNWEAPLLRLFGLDEPDTHPSPQLLAYLGMKREGDVALKELLANPSVTYVRPQDIARLKEDPERQAHVTTALLRKWFRRWLLPAQSLLSDLPHLAAALPWGLVDYTRSELWDLLAKNGRTSNQGDLATLMRPEVLKHRFSHEDWVGRPTFFRARVSAALEQDSGLLSSFEPRKLPKLAFVEDLSRFVPIEQSVEYSVTLDGESQLRSVSAQGKCAITGNTYGLEQIVYSPESLIL